MNEETDLIKEYAKRLEEQHRSFMIDCVKRPNKEYKMLRLVRIYFAEIRDVYITMNDIEYYAFVTFISSINRSRQLTFYEIARWIRVNAPTNYKFLSWWDATDTRNWIYPKDKFTILDVDDGSRLYTKVLVGGLVKPVTIGFDISPSEYIVRYSKADCLAVRDALNIKNVIFNNPATIVFWTDGTKTVCVCSKEDTYDPEKGLALCVMKKTLYNNKGHIFNNAREKWLKKARKD